MSEMKPWIDDRGIDSELLADLRAEREFMHDRDLSSLKKSVLGLGAVGTLGAGASKAAASFGSAASTISAGTAASGSSGAVAATSILSTKVLLSAGLALGIVAYGGGRVHERTLQEEEVQRVLLKAPSRADSSARGLDSFHIEENVQDSRLEALETQHAQTRIHFEGMLEAYEEEIQDLKLERDGLVSLLTTGPKEETSVQANAKVKIAKVNSQKDQSKVEPGKEANRAPRFDALKNLQRSKKKSLGLTEKLRKDSSHEDGLKVMIAELDSLESEDFPSTNLEVSTQENEPSLNDFGIEQVLFQEAKDAKKRGQIGRAQKLFSDYLKLYPKGLHVEDAQLATLSLAIDKHQYGRALRLLKEYKKKGGSKSFRAKLNEESIRLRLNEGVCDSKVAKEVAQLNPGIRARYENLFIKCRARNTLN